MPPPGYKFKVCNVFKPAEFFIGLKRVEYEPVPGRVTVSSPGYPEPLKAQVMLDDLDGIVPRLLRAGNKWLSGVWVERVEGDPFRLCIFWSEMPNMKAAPAPDKSEAPAAAPPRPVPQATPRPPPLPRPSMRACSACHGSGYTTIHMPGGPVRAPCATCKGTGRVKV